MKRIIKSSSAPYPKTNTSEMEAISAFLHVLNKERVKLDIKYFDKVPNIDGIIEVVSENQVSVGKMEVQIKKLGNKNINKPKYQCSVNFLAYCEVNIQPVLLIVVDVANSIAYWHHMDKPTILNLGKIIDTKGTKSVSLEFNPSNMIATKDLEYIGKWENIIASYQEKILDYDELKKRGNDLNAELEEMKALTNSAVGKVTPIFKEIHFFLDAYNGLLDDDFLTIKNILYPNYWKIGFGIRTYNKNKVSFSLYPIHYNLNDVLIKEYKLKSQFYRQNAFTYIGHNMENPIKTRPIEYAYQLIEKDTLKVLEKNPLLVNNIFLAKEYIIAFIDEFYLVLGLEQFALKYSVKDIEYSLNMFLPLWIESIISKSVTPEIKLPPYLIDYIYLHRSKENISKVSEKVKKDLSEGKQPTLNLKFYSESYNISNVFHLIKYLKLINVNEIEREYKMPISITKRVYYKWETWSEEDTLKNIEVFYNHYSKIYDLLVKTYFPNLFSELQFFNNFNLLIVVIEFNSNAYERAPSIHLYKLNSTSPAENKIIVYNANDENTPSHFQRENLSYFFNMNKIDIDGISYNLSDCCFSVMDFIYKKTPIYYSINNLLIERLKLYFETKKKR